MIERLKIIMNGQHFKVYKSLLHLIKPCLDAICSIKRPCKIWAPYVGQCVEKSLALKSKYVDTPKTGSINCLGRTIPMVLVI